MKRKTKASKAGRRKTSAKPLHAGTQIAKVLALIKVTSEVNDWIAKRTAGVPIEIDEASTIAGARE